MIFLASAVALADNAVQITPPNPTTDNSLQCYVVTGGTGYTYKWDRNNVPQNINGQFISPALTYVGDNWRCTVKKYYGSYVGWVTIGSHSVNILPSVNLNPTVSIVTPLDGDQFNYSDMVLFTGTAVDPEDGALVGDDLVWMSSINGNFGNGTSVSLDTLSVGIHTITLTATDSQGATGTDAITITILLSSNQAPNVTIILPNDGDNFTIGDTIDFAGTGVDMEDGILTGDSLVWTSDLDGNFGNGTSFSLDTLSEGTHIITLTGIDSSGINATDSITINILPVNQAPNVTIILPVDGDNFTTADLIDFVGVAADPEDGILTGDSLVWTSNLDGNFANGTNNLLNLTAGTHIITLTATDSQGLTGSDTVTIYVSATNQDPTILIINPNDGDNFSCNSLISFEALLSDPDGDNVTILWSSNVDGDFGNETPFVNGNLTCGTDHVITAVASDGNGGLATDSITIRIENFTNPAPFVDITLPLNNSQFVRACEIIHFEANAFGYNGANITSYSWVYGGTEIGSNSSFDIAATTFALGNQTVSLQVRDDLGGVNTTSVTIELIAHTPPTVTITSPLDGSIFWDWETILFDATATPTDLCPTNFTWIWRDNSLAIINQSQSFSTDELEVGNHTITVYIVDSYNASAYDSVNITINETPNEIPLVSIIEPVNGTQYINQCQIITFTSDAYDLDGDIIEYRWYWGSTVINTSANFTMPASDFGVGNHTVLLTVRDNSSAEASATANFEVIRHLAPTVTITSPINGSNWTEIDTIPFSATATANDICPTNFSYTWMESGNIVNYSDTFNLVNLSPGMYTFIVLAEDDYDLQAVDTVTINVSEIPNQLPVIITPITCVNATGGSVLNELEPIFCSANATDNDGNITTWAWAVQGEYGPIFTPFNLTVPYPYLLNGTYNVSLTLVDNEGGQTNTSLLIDVLNNVPVVTLTSNYTAGLYEPQTILYTCSVTQGTGNEPYSYTLDFGNGVSNTYVGNETELNFTITYTQNITVDVVCTVVDMDGDVGNDTLTIDILDTVPQGNFNFTPAMPYECSAVQFTSNVTAYDGILSYFWDFTDGSNSTLQDPSHNFTQDGNYNVVLTVFDFDNSFATFTNTVPVQDTMPLVEAGPDRNVTEGNNLTFVGSAIKVCDNITGYEWDFGDGTPIQTGQVVSHNFTQNGTFLVVFTAIDSDGSRASDNLTVTVFDTVPNANFTIEPNPQYEGLVVTFNASSSTGYDQPLTYTWDFGDNNTATGEFATHTYAQQGIYMVTLTVIDSDGSVDNMTQAVAILDTVPVANFTVNPNPVVEGQPTTFDASLSTAYDIPMNYTWDFGDGTNGTGMNIAHTYVQNGTYLATLTVTDNDGSQSTQSIIVTVTDTVPIAAFTYVPTNPVEGFQINFTDGSVAYDGIVDWEWNFGDGSPLSTIQNATHIYIFNGTYNVTLTVWDGDGSIDSVTQQIVVANLLPIITLTPASASGVEPLYVTFNCTATGNTPFTFLFDEEGDGSYEHTVSSSTGALFGVNYTQNGTYNPVCTVYDVDGDSASASSLVIVTDTVPTAVLFGNLTLNEGETGIYDASNSTAYDSPLSYEWDFNYPSAFAGGVSVESHTFNDSGIYQVAVQVTDTDGSQDVAIITVNVANLPPTVTFLPPETSLYETNESTAITFWVIATDPSIVDELAGFTYEWDFDYRSGIFTVDATTSTPFITMNWTDDLNVTIAVRAVDKDGGISDPAFADLLVNNVPPTAILAGPYICSNQIITTVPNVTLFSIVNDPGTDTFIHLWNITGITPVQINTPDRNSSVLFVCTGQPTGIYDVTFEVWDDDWGYSGVYTTFINVTDALANLPPTILVPMENESIPVTVNTSSNYTIFAFDPNGDALTFFINDTHVAFGPQNTSGGFTTVTMSYMYPIEGVYEINLTVCDDSGYANNCTSRLFSFNVTNQTFVNIAPVAIILPPFTGDEGVPVTFDASSSYDTDGSIWLYNWTFGDGNSLLTASPVINHTYMDNGTYPVTLTVYDNLGASNSTTQNFTIANLAPVITVTSPISMQEDIPLTVQLTATDVDTITWSATPSANINVAVNGDNLTLTPAGNWSGSEIITITATDSDGAISTMNVQVDVAAVNDAPVIVPPVASLPATEDLFFTYTISATDVDGPSITYGLVNAPAGMTVDPVTGVISWTPTNANVGLNVFNITASDGTLQDSEQVIVDVANVPATILTTTPPTSWSANVTYIYDFNSDDDGQGTITYSLTVDGVPSAAINSATGIVSWLPTEAKVYDLVVTVNDGYADTPFAWSVNVTTAGPITYALALIPGETNMSVPVNNQAIYGFGLVNIGTLADTYTITITNLDGADIASLSQTSASLNPGETDFFTLTVMDAVEGNYTVSVTATSDSDGTVFEIVNITTTVLPLGAYALTLTDPVDQSVEENVDAVYTLTVTNIGSLPDNFSVMVINFGGADFASLNDSIIELNPGQSADFTLTVMDATAGTYEVVVSAVSLGDPSVFDMSSIITTVTPAVLNYSLTLTDPADQTVYVNNNAIYVLTVTNTGTLADTYTISANNLGGADVASLSQTSATLNPGESEVFTLTVLDAAAGTYDVNVTATSNSDGTVFETVSITTTVLPAGAYGVILTDPADDSVEENVNAVYTITITNTGPSADTYDLAVNNLEGADVASLNTTVISLNSGASTTFTLTVMDAVADTYEVLVSATSQGDTSVVDTISITTTVTPASGPAGNGTVINSTVYGIFYAQNTTAEVSAGSGVAIDNSTSMLNATISGTVTPIVNSQLEYVNVVDPVVIDNCIILGTPTGVKEVIGSICQNTFIDPASIGYSDVTGSSINESHVWYSNATYSAINDSTIDYSNVNNSQLQTAIILRSNVTDSIVNFSTIQDSTIDTAVITESTVIECNIENSNVTSGSVLSQCVVVDSTVENSTITNSTIINSTINTSVIINSTINNSVIINSTINNSNVIDGIIINNTITNGTICIGENCYNATEDGSKDITQLPYAILSADPESHTGAFDSTLTATAYYFNATNLTYYFDFDNDGTYDFNTTTNETSVNVIHTYDVTSTTKVKISNNAGSTAVDYVTLTVNSGGGGGGGSSGGNAGAIIVPYASVNHIDLESETPQTVVVDFFDGISFDYNGVTYSIVFTNVSEKHVDMTIYPPRIPVTLLERGSTMVNLDDEPTDDLSIILNDIEKLTVEDITAGIGRVKYRINLTLNLVKLQKKETVIIDLEGEGLVDEIKSGVLDVISNITPKEKPSAVVGTTITAGIILAGLAGYLIFRKKTPKMSI